MCSVYLRVFSENCKLDYNAYLLIVNTTAARIQFFQNVFFPKLQYVTPAEYTPEKA